VKIRIVVLWVIAMCRMVDINVLRNLTASAFRVSVVMLLILPYKLMCAPLLKVGNNKVHVGMVSSVVITHISTKSMQQFLTSNMQLNEKTERQTDMVCHVCVYSVYVVQMGKQILCMQSELPWHWL